MLFLQLPIPEIHDLYSTANIPLAAGYLKAVALKYGLAPRGELHIFDRDVINYGGDAALLRAIRDEGPHIAAFTSYMWNIDRDIYLARRIKEADPSSIIIFGGPEIASNHPVLENKDIDAFVIGEGELAFCDFLRDVNEHRPIQRVYQSNTHADLTEVPNPYIEKILIPSQRESILMETMRGCPYSCSYCFYSKSFSRIRFFNEDRLSPLFELARQYGVPEIYWMDPSFNVAPALEERLRKIRDLNSTGIPIHTEIRVESVTPTTAALMKEAGFKSVEAGLQSIYKNALAAVGRTWNREKFVQGVKQLLQQGIDVKTGVILGLPNDTPQWFDKTLDFVIGSNLHPSMEIYPLSVLPGTALREQAASLGLKYMPHPPYWVTSTPTISEDDFRGIIENIQYKLDIEFFPPIIPRFANFHSWFVHFLDLRQNSHALWDNLFDHPWRIGHSLTIMVGEPVDWEKLCRFGLSLKNSNPFTLVQLVVDSPTIPPQDEINRLKEAFYNPLHFFNHIHHFKIDAQETYSFRMYHATDRLETAFKYLEEPLYCDLIVRFTPTFLRKGRKILEEKPILLVEGEVNPRDLTLLKRVYKGFDELLIMI